ncbi:hypothetical protein [Rubritalea profundi]|uniref:MBG domain-containing protein n=1 Tax=Rubritalea profundi TaxID=1658618 RepID=A0A2S7U1A6_9BACT|nr:hypothetical protein [Rubritalea profundi]PQJ28370.1 hypothetical protein BSZ32_07485 [Rubritalea profundi]
MEISSLTVLSSIAIALNCPAALITSLSSSVSTDVGNSVLVSETILGLSSNDSADYSAYADPIPEPIPQPEDLPTPTLFPVPFESTQLLDFGDAKDGNITSSATELTLSAPVGGAFSYTGANTNSLNVNDSNDDVTLSDKKAFSCRNFSIHH